MKFLYLKPQFRVFFAALTALALFTLAAGQAEDNSTYAPNTDVISQVQNIQDSQKNPLQMQPQPEIEQAQPPEDVSKQPREKLILKTIRFEGNETISDEDLEPIASEWENKAVSFQDIKDLIQKITALYRSRGYLLTRAYLPPQKIQNGEVLIQILEGQTGEIKIEDNRWFKKQIYKNYFNDLLQEKIFRYSDLESIIRTRSPPDKTFTFLSDSSPVKSRRPKNPRINCS